jgi:hypothetical protein
LILKVIRQDDTIIAEDAFVLKDFSLKLINLLFEGIDKEGIGVSVDHSLILDVSRSACIFYRVQRLLVIALCWGHTGYHCGA